MTYWRDLPSLVVAREGDTVTKSQLASRFQEAIDEAAMRLGATVTGTIQLGSAPAIEVPASALTEASGRPAVWLVDPTSQTVSLRNIDVARYEPNTVVVSQGLEAGEIVVTAGVQALRPGQKVRLLGATS